MRNHKLIFASSPDREYPYHVMWYNSFNERLLLLYLQQIISGLPKQARVSWTKILFLLKRMQIFMEQNASWLLARKEITSSGYRENYKKSCRYFGIKQSALERWTKSRQGWLCFNLEPHTPKFGLSWLYKRASFNYGRKNWEILNTQGGCTPC